MAWRTRLPRWNRLGMFWQGAPGRLQRGSRDWLNSCVELVFPSTCLLCGQSTFEEQTRICGKCQAALTNHGAARCVRCARPLPPHWQRDSGNCPFCRSKRWRFHQAIALGTYGSDVRELVLRIKQPRHESLCLAAGELLAQRIRAELLSSPPDIVVPVPMHWLRKLLRGTNDAEVLAESVGKWLHVPWKTGALRCLRPTQKQGTLLPTEREQNVRGAYRVRNRRKFKGMHLLVVDDVMTTGATANEIAKVLRRAGASRVTVAVIARGIGYG